MLDFIFANVTAIEFRRQRYEDEDIAFIKGEQDFIKGETENPYENEQFPNPNVIIAWKNGYETAKKNKLNHQEIYI